MSGISNRQPCISRDGLPHFAEKLRGGARTLRIACLGGSITQASGWQSPGWRVQVVEALQREYPAVRFEGINAGIGGTGSLLGMFRVRNDVLEANPDLVLIEFAVNDLNRKPDEIIGSMEGIVRQTRRYDSTIDICLVYADCEAFEPILRQGMIPPQIAAMEDVADHYGIPSIHMASEVSRLIAKGAWILKEKGKSVSAAGLPVFSPDGIHPYPETGHRLYAGMIVDAVRTCVKTASPPPRELPVPLNRDHWEDAKLIPFSPAAGAGWTYRERDALLPLTGTPLPGIWETDIPGTPISFRFRGRFLGFYEILGPDSGIVIHSIDGKETRVSHFQDDCYIHRHKLIPVIEEKTDAEYFVTLTLRSDRPDISACLKRANDAGIAVNPGQLGKNHVWRVAGFAVIGEIR